MREANANFSELDVAKESATAGKGGKLYSERKRGFRWAQIGGCWHGRGGAEMGNYKWGILRDWLGYIADSPVGYKFEAGTKTKEAFGC